jgi:hypothetical protein
MDVLSCISHTNNNIEDAAVSCNNKLVSLNLSKQLV